MSAERMNWQRRHEYKDSRKTEDFCILCASKFNLQQSAVEILVFTCKSKQRLSVSENTLSSLLSSF